MSAVIDTFGPMLSAALVFGHVVRWFVTLMMGWTR